MMKKIKKVIALLLAVANLTAFAACTQRTAGETLAQNTAAGSTGEVTPEPTKPLAEQKLEDNYGYQISAFLDRQYYFEGEPVPIAETNYYFIDSYLTLNQYAAYGGYPLLDGGFVDLSASMGTELREDGTFKTYGDFLVEYAERVIESTLIVDKLAREQGLTLSDESRESIDTMISTFNERFAIPENITLDQLFNLYYSDAVGEAEFRQIMENYYLAETYTNNYVDSFEFSEGQLYHPTVRYALYSAPEMTSTQDVLDSQEELANALFDECDNDVDMFELLGSTRQSSGEVTEYGEITVAKDQTVPAFDAWVFDESRQEGDMTVLYAPEYGYFVVGYMGKSEIDYSEKQQIAVAALGDEVTAAIESGEYEFYTNDPVKHVPDAEEVAKLKEGINTTRIILIVLICVGVVMLIAAVILLIRSRKASEQKKADERKAAMKRPTPSKKKAVESDEESDEDPGDFQVDDGIEDDDEVEDEEEESTEE